MDFTILSKDEIEQGVIVPEPCVPISISDPRIRKPKIRIAGLCRDILYLRFSDAEPVEGFEHPPEIKLITPRQARAIWRFVDRYKKDIDTIVVHCHAGMSRSPAVAAAICRGLGGDDSWFFQEYQPNQYVYQVILEARQGFG